MYQGFLAGRVIHCVTISACTFPIGLNIPVVIKIFKVQ